MRAGRSGVRGGLFLMLLMGLFWALGCEPEAEEKAEGEQAQAEAKKEAGVEVLTVEVVYPDDQAHRTTTYRVMKTSEGYQENGNPLPADRVDALFSASEAGLVGSDGIRSCRGSKRNFTFRVTLHEQGKVFESNALCKGWAPWNVRSEGKLWVQLDGTFGQALLPLMRAIDQPNWAPIEQPKTGRINLTRKEAVPEGLEAQAMSMPDAATVQGWEPFKKAFGEVEVSDFRVLCSQERSPSCETLFAVAKAPYKKGRYAMQFEVAVEGEKLVELQLPDEEVIKTLFKSKLMKTFMKSVSDETPIELVWAKDYECRHVQGGARLLKPKEDPSGLACDVLTVRYENIKAEGLPPVLHYYPALDAARLEGWAYKTDIAFFEGLGSHKDVRDTLILDRVWLYADLNGEIKEVAK